MRRSFNPISEGRYTPKGQNPSAPQEGDSKTAASIQEGHATTRERTRVLPAASISERHPHVMRISARAVPGNPPNHGIESAEFPRANAHHGRE